MRRNNSLSEPRANDETLLLIFADMRQPVRFVNCADLLQHFSLLFPGWSILESFDHALQPVLSIRRDGRDYEISGYWIEQPLRRGELVDALCALVAELVRAWVRQDDRLLCLHGAAAEFDGRLVVFPSHYRSGKSVLTASLAAAGIRVFGDDVLPLSIAEGEGIAPGLAPRLRLPLPDRLRPATRRFIEAQRRLSGRKYTYLDLDSTLMAPRGWRLPLGAFVLLERVSCARATLETIGEAEVLGQIVWQNFAREAEAPRILEVLARLAGCAQRYRLRYDCVDDAVDLLCLTFNRWPDAPARAQRPPRGLNDDRVAAQEPARGCYLRNADIHLQRSDDQVFLADRSGAAIYQLNSIAGAIWTLLDEPMAVDAICEILRHAFPQLDAAQVEADVVRLCREMEEKNLLSYGGD